VERAIVTGDSPRLLVLESDVQMLVVSYGGGERTAAEYRALLAAGGFDVRRLIAVLPPFYAVEAARM
jgi:hypothetical protein